MAACIVNADHCQIELYNDHAGRLYVGHSGAEISLKSVKLLEGSLNQF